MMMRVMLFLPMEKKTMNRHARMLVSPPKVQLLLAGADRSKDQTYFLSGVKGKALQNVIFPLGHLAKSQSAATQVNNNNDSNGNNNNFDQTVRDIAQHANIPTASKRDSMGICFIGK